MELSLVMPCLDEAGTVAESVRCAHAFLWDEGIDGEVLVVDNGSRDASAELAAAAGARVISVADRGYGRAIMGGVVAARGRYVAMADCDGSYDIRELAGLLGALRDGADLVMGDRFAGGIATGAMPWLNRKVGNPCLSTIVRVLFRTGVGDVNCGMRAFDRRAILALGLKAPGMEFASEMVLRAVLAGYEIGQRPVSLSRDGRGGRSGHLRPWRDGWRHLRLIVRIRLTS